MGMVETTQVSEYLGIARDFTGFVLNWWSNHITIFVWFYPLVMTHVAIEHGHWKFVDLPSYKMVIFDSYVSLPENNIYIYTYLVLLSSVIPIWKAVTIITLWLQHVDGKAKSCITERMVETPKKCKKNTVFNWCRIRGTLRFCVEKPCWLIILGVCPSLINELGLSSPIYPPVN